MANVFISHSGRDRQVAAEVHEWLEDAGHRTFLDNDVHDGLVVGEGWEERLYERLRWADAVVCVVTAAYVASEWCRNEVVIALSRRCPVLPLVVEPGVKHPRLQTRQHASYARDPETAMAAIGEALRRIDASGGRGWPDDRSPFPGLQPFDAELHRAFFGRDPDVARLVRLLGTPAPRQDRGLILVVGPSGCGKSSLARAGLLPSLADQPDWLALRPFWPGSDPLAGLAVELTDAARQQGLGWTLTATRERLADSAGLTALAQELLMAAPGRRRHHLLVVVDQLEELLTETSPAARAAFTETLRPAITGPVTVLATIRSESLSGLLASPEVADLQVQTFLPLRPLRRDALAEIIRGPADLAGIEVDDALVSRLVADTDSGEALPLLAFTLAELAGGVGRGGRLSMSRYEELGGVQGALRRQADTALAAACSASGRPEHAVIGGLLQLVHGDEHGDPTRWRARLDALPDPLPVELQPFVARGLLTTDADESGAVLIGVTHEAFLSAWPPLAQVITANASALRARREIEIAAADWAESGHPLWEGSQLAAGVAALKARLRRVGRPRWPLSGKRVVVTDRVELSPRAREFLARAMIRERRRTGRGYAILSTLLAIAIVTGGVAVYQQQVAVYQQRIATARELTTQAEVLRDSQPRVSLMLSLEALRLGGAGDARAGLVATLMASHYAGIVRGHVGGVDAVAFSSDGRTLATGGLDRATILWDVGDPARPVRLATIENRASAVLAVAISPDGRTLVTSGDDHTAILWDLRDRSHPIRLATLAHAAFVFAIAFSPDGRTLATAVGGPQQESSDDRSAFLWDVGDRSHPTRLATLSGHAGSVLTVAFSPDGRTLATGSADRTAILWDVGDHAHPARLAALAEDSDRVFSVAFSPDRRTVAVGSADGFVSVWDVAKPAHPVHVATLNGHTGAVDAVAYSSDGHDLAVSSADHTTILWDMTDPSKPIRVSTLGGHSGSIYAARFSGDGRTLVTGSDDRTAILWDLDDRSRLTRVVTTSDHTDQVVTLAFSPDHHTLATGGLDRSVILWDVTDRSHPVHLSTLPHAAGVYALSFSPDGRTLAAGTGRTINGRSGEHAVVLWDVSDRARPVLLATLSDHVEDVNAVAFSPDGRTLASGSMDRTASLWDVSDRSHPARLANLSGHANEVLAVAFSPDSHTLATGSSDHTVMLWNVSNRTHPARLATIRGHTDVVTALAFRPDGRVLATGGGDQAAMLWDVHDGAHPTRLATVGGHTNAVTGVAFSHDGRMLATGSLDRTVMLTDVSDSAHPAPLITTGLQDSYVNAVAFSADDRTVATGTQTAVLWDAGTAITRSRDAERLACAVAGPSLSRAEWAQYVPQWPYERICP